MLNNKAMQIFQNLQDLWQAYFVQVAPTNNTDTWAIVYIAHDNHKLFISLANPYKDQWQEIYVSYITHNDVITFITHYKKRFLQQLPQRFGFFRPEVNTVLTEYPDWQTFYKAWLDDDSQLLQANMPLLFDYPSADEYWAMQLKQADCAGYRRLLIVLYQYRKQQFQKVFIKSVDDATYAMITKKICEFYATVMPTLFLKEP
jgi:hypothetical protein